MVYARSTENMLKNMWYNKLAKYKNNTKLATYVWEVKEKNNKNPQY